MLKYIKITAVIAVSLTSICFGDIFKHRVSGETFYGYATQTTRADQTKVFIQEGEKFTSKIINSTDYEIKYSKKGRKNEIIVIPVNHSSILLSETITGVLEKTIVDASNAGPLYIILEIDSPGGRGEQMQKLASTIKKTDNCPVAAFITGENYGGAYSAAAGIALACDMIFIAPTASMGTIALQGSADKSEILTAAESQEIYSPVSNSSYGKYLASFAKEKSRPEALAAAMVDTGIEVVEVIVDQRGSRDIVAKSSKKPGDSIVKTWSTKLQQPTVSSYGTGSFTDKETSAQPIMYVTLSADDAIYTKMADTIAADREEVIEKLGASDAKVTVAHRIRRHLLSFKRNLTRVTNLFAGIDEMESRAEELEKQYEKVRTAALNNLSDIENERMRRMRRELYKKQLERNTRRISPNNRHYLSPDEVEAVERELRQSQVNPYMVEQNRVLGEYVYVLQELHYAYSSVLSIANQYPGTMPPDRSKQDISVRLGQIASRLNFIMFGQPTR